MRNKNRNPHNDVVSAALDAMRRALSSSGTSPSVSQETSTPAQTITTAGTDANGNTVTRYAAMTQLDSTESNAMTS